MKKIHLLVIASIALSACSSVDSLKPFDQQQAAILLQQHGSTQPSKQMVSFDLPKREMWKKISFSPDETSSFVMLVPQQESASNFSESIQARTLPIEHNPDVTAVKYVNAEIDQAKKTCQQTSAKILSESAHDITYRLDASECRNKKMLWQIGKVFNGTDGVYSVRYIAEAGKVSEVHFNQIAPFIKSATLIHDPRANF